MLEKILVIAFFISFAAAATAVDTLTATRVATGFSLPLFADAPPGDKDRLFIVEKVSGQNSGINFANIRILNLDDYSIEATPFLTVPGLSSTNEGGLLGMAFHPDYATNGYFYVMYTDTSNDSQLVRYTVSGNPNVANAGSETPILEILQPFGNHNGGWIDFGPDNYLYVSLGDGGSGCDPQDNGQDKTTLLGKMLRIDVDGDDFPGDANVNYAIPSTNPFFNDALPVGLRKEIWAYGLRNPWRASFDRETGDLYIGDVGQGEREELNFQPANSLGGENYGWRLREGLIQTPIGGNDCDAGVGGAKPADNVDPVFDYQRGSATGEIYGTTVTGGYVYRGKSPNLQGHYFFADYILCRL